MLGWDNSVSTICQVGRVSSGSGRIHCFGNTHSSQLIRQPLSFSVEFLSHTSSCLACTSKHCCAIVSGVSGLKYKHGVNCVTALNRLYWQCQPKQVQNNKLITISQEQNVWREAPSTVNVLVFFIILHHTDGHTYIFKCVRTASHCYQEEEGKAIDKHPHPQGLSLHLFHKFLWFIWMFWK